MGIEDRMDFAPGVPTDPSAIPQLRYQLLNGQVFTLTVWPSGSTARGSVPVGELQDRVGSSELEEGWYDALGEYLGDDPGLTPPPAEPAFPRE